MAAGESSDPAARAVVVPHGNIPEYSYHGNSLWGVATPGLGAKQYEVWRASLPPHSQTPPGHWHETEEIFIFLRGSGTAVVDGHATPFAAPCTVILPARVPHYMHNAGDEPTDHFVIIGANSSIFDKDGEQMELPWRT